MRFGRRFPIAAASLHAFVAVVACAHEPAPLPADAALVKLLGPSARIIRLWPEIAPDEIRPIGDETVVVSEKKSALFAEKVTQPSLVVCPPPHLNSPAPLVVVCPGGGYGSLGIESEGADFVKRLNERGIIGAVLKYRVPKRHQGFPQHHHALQDAQRALGLVRQNAKAWNVDPRQVGIAGFSAGGHLAASLSNNYTVRLYPKVDAADDQSCRPDFTLLIYPAYLTDPIDSDKLDPLQHVDQMSNRATPPTFIAVAQADKFARGSVAYFMALRAARVRGELHIYDGGGHGNGLREPPLGEWIEPCGRWLRPLTSPPPPAPAVK